MLLRKVFAGLLLAGAALSGGCWCCGSKWGGCGGGCASCCTPCCSPCEGACCSSCGSSPIVGMPEPSLLTSRPVATIPPH